MWTGEGQRRGDRGERRRREVGGGQGDTKGEKKAGGKGWRREVPGEGQEGGGGRGREGEGERGRGRKEQQGAGCRVQGCRREGHKAGWTKGEPRDTASRPCAAHMQQVTGVLVRSGEASPPPLSPPPLHPCMGTAPPPSPWRLLREHGSCSGADAEDQAPGSRAGAGVQGLWHTQHRLPQTPPLSQPLPHQAQIPPPWPTPPLLLQEGHRRPTGAVSR